LPPSKKLAGDKKPDDQGADDSPAAVSPEDIKREYNKVARSANLISIWLIEERFDMKSAYIKKSMRGENINLAFKDDCETIWFESEEGSASAIWVWDISARDGRAKCLSIRAKYLIIYDSLEECAEPAVHAFLRRVGRFATYPYFRARVSQLSADSGADLPIMPVIST